jgi:hypothetical protein
MTWGDGKKIIFKRGDKYIEQTDHVFVGHSKDRSQLQVIVDTEYEENRPDDNCRAYIAYIKPNGTNIHYLGINID